MSMVLNSLSLFESIGAPYNRIDGGGNRERNEG
jgi:hypothetical protein